MNKIWRSTNSKNTCPSCAALHGQVHSEQDWKDLQPGHASLYCKDGCNCALTETDEPETGSIADAPLRQLGEPMTDITLQLKATPTDDGFDILAISEGEAKGHGITFSSAVLQDGMHLYNNKPVFIDHAGLFESPSVRDLAGTISSPGWNMNQKGIMAKLRPSGPAKQVLLDVRDAAKADPAILEAVGFSTVLNVKLDTKGNVTKIVRVKSVDVVIDPARGGKFLSARNTGHMKGEQTMNDQENEQVADKTEEAAALAMQGANEQIAQLREDAKAQRAIHIANLRNLLDSSLAGSKLPTASQKAVRKPFEIKLDSDETFLPTELQEAIKDKREELAALNSQVEGPGRGSMIGAMFSGVDQVKAALADLLGAERDEGLEKLRVRPFSGIREAYTLITGDVSFMGGYHPEFALVSANFPGIVSDLLNKVLIKAWNDLANVYGWWEAIVTVEHFNNLQDPKWIRTGTIASLPVVLERGEYQELPIGDNKESSDWAKYGGYIPLTLEAVINDDIRAFRRMPREAALAGRRNISEQVAAIFTQNSAAGPVMADGGALFNSTAQTTAGGHLNLLTTALGTDYVAWAAVATAMYKKKMLVKNASGYYGTGKPYGVRPKFCLVPADLSDQAFALFVPRLAAVLTTAGIPTKGQPNYGGSVEPITVPEWTDATDWAAVADPAITPGVMLGEIFGLVPQIFNAGSEMDPAMFANDESRLKVRQFVNVGVADDLPLAKNNVA